MPSSMYPAAFTCRCRSALPTSAGKVVFEVDLTDGVDLKDLKGKPLTVTMIDGKGQAETTITLE